MRSLIILFLALFIVSCKQNSKPIGDLREKDPITAVPSDTGNRDVSPISGGNHPSDNRVSDHPDYEKQLVKIKEEISQTMAVLGENGQWKLRFVVMGQAVRIDTDLLFKLRFSNLSFLPSHKSDFILDLEKMQDKLLEWQKKYKEAGEIEGFSENNRIFWIYQTIFKNGAEELADQLISETDNFFHICNQDVSNEEDGKYLPIISLRSLFPQKSCKELYQFYNDEEKRIRIEAARDVHFTDLQALRGFFNITNLIIHGGFNSLLDESMNITPLREMKYLEYFESGYNKLSDLSPLAKLKRLTYISIFPQEEFKYLKVCPTDSENQALNKFCTKAGFPR